MITKVYECDGGHTRELLHPMDENMSGTECLFFTGEYVCNLPLHWIPQANPMLGRKKGHHNG